MSSQPFRAQIKCLYSIYSRHAHTDIVAADLKSSRSNNSDACAHKCSTTVSLSHVDKLSPFSGCGVRESAATDTLQGAASDILQMAHYIRATTMHAHSRQRAICCTDVHEILTAAAPVFTRLQRPEHPTRNESVVCRENWEVDSFERC